MIPWRWLEQPFIWEMTRVGLDLTFGLYRKRMELLSQWGVLENAPSILDIGCGIGSYAKITTGNYLGIDSSAQYIDHARKRHREANQSFHCVDVRELLQERAAFDMVLMVDFLHHLPDDVGTELLQTAARLARKYIVSFEPITYQPHPVGRWIVEHDRGNYVRPLDRLMGLIEGAGLQLMKSQELRLGPINTWAVLAQAQTKVTP